MKKNTKIIILVSVGLISLWFIKTVIGLQLNDSVVKAEIEDQNYFQNERHIKRQQLAVKLNPRNITLTQNMVDMYVKQNKLQYAINCHKDLMNKRKNLFDGYLILGMLYDLDQDNESAQKCYEKYNDLLKEYSQKNLSEKENINLQASISILQFLENGVLTSDNVIYGIKDKFDDSSIEILFEILSGTSKKAFIESRFDIIESEELKLMK